MKAIKIKQCIGEGQGACRRCTENGKWNRAWMNFLYEIEGRDGIYCYDCMKELTEGYQRTLNKEENKV